MRYAVIPEFPTEDDLQCLSEKVCKILGLPEEHAHPSSIARAGNQVADVYRVIFRTYGISSNELSGD